MELAAGRPIGTHPEPPATHPSAGDPLDALERAILPALQNPPCRVSFSGGRDSSLVLAAAQRTARRHGLASPVPITMRFHAEAEAYEQPWQEQVIAHVGVADWERVDREAELDLLGEASTAILRRSGSYYPANAHALQPLLATEGSLLTGLGGDELFNPSIWQRHNDLLARRRRRPTRRDAADGAVRLVPRPMRGPWVRRVAGQSSLPWLTPRAAARLRRLDAREDNAPVHYPAALRHEAGRRSTRMAVSTLARLGADHGVAVQAPLLDAGFVAALGRAGGRRGFGSRTQAMRAVAFGLLPDEVLRRRQKATFTGTFYGPASRAFVAEWSGGGVPLDLVDPARLRAAWTGGDGDFRAALLLHAAWLHDAGR